MRKPKAKPEDIACCRNCKHFLPNDADTYGFCRRYPPVYVATEDGGDYEQPPVEASETCGEFSRKCQA